MPMSIPQTSRPTSSSLAPVTAFKKSSTSTTSSSSSSPSPPAPKYMCRACQEHFPNWSQCLSHVRTSEKTNDPQLHSMTTTPEGRRELQKLCKYVAPGEKERERVRERSSGEFGGDPLSATSTPSISTVTTPCTTPGSTPATTPRQGITVGGMPPSHLHGSFPSTSAGFPASLSHASAEERQLSSWIKQPPPGLERVDRVVAADVRAEDEVQAGKQGIQGTAGQEEKWGAGLTHFIPPSSVPSGYASHEATRRRSIDQNDAASFSSMSSVSISPESTPASSPFGSPKRSSQSLLATSRRPKVPHRNCSESKEEWVSFPPPGLTPGMNAGVIGGTGAPPGLVRANSTGLLPKASAFVVSSPFPSSLHHQQQQGQQHSVASYGGSSLHPQGFRSAWPITPRNKSNSSIDCLRTEKRIRGNRLAMLPDNAAITVCQMIDLIDVASLLRMLKQE